MLRSDDGSLLVDEILHTANDHVLVKDGGKTYNIDENVTIIEKVEGDAMDSRWKAYEDEGLTPEDVARLLAKYTELKNRGVTKQKNPSRTPTNDPIADAIRKAIKGERTVYGGTQVIEDTDGAIRKAQYARDPAAVALGASLEADD